MSQESPNINCSECGAAFRCGATAGEKACWCFALPHRLPVPKESSEARGCLCPKCLEEAIAKPLNQNTQAKLW
jgi:uncharacterized protein